MRLQLLTSDLTVECIPLLTGELMETTTLALSVPENVAIHGTCRFKKLTSLTSVRA